MGEGKKYVICEKELEVYRRDMLENERSRATIEKYIRDVRAFCRWNGEKEIDRLRVLEWKEYLGRNYAVSSANSMLAALNKYFDFRGWEELRVKPFRQHPANDTAAVPVNHSGQIQKSTLNGDVCNVD